MKHSEILIAAKKLLWNGIEDYHGNSHTYICNAVNTVVRDSEDQEAISNAEEIKAKIKRRMNGYGTLNEFLSTIGLNSQNTCLVEFQSYRHKFVDELIFYYQCFTK